VEGAGAVGLAALISGKLQHLNGKRYKIYIFYYEAKGVEN
jgi:threonine dehydratase